MISGNADRDVMQKIVHKFTTRKYYVWISNMFMHINMRAVEFHTVDIHNDDDDDVILSEH